MLLKRNLTKYQNIRGERDIPGGRINPESKLIENLKREVKEETGLPITSEPKLIHAQDIIPNPERHIVRLSYVGDTAGEPVLDTEENIEYKWLSLAELKKHKNLDVYVREILDKSMLG